MSWDDGVAGPARQCVKWGCQNASLVVVWDQAVKPQAICPKCGACYGKANARWLLKQWAISETPVQRKLREMGTKNNPGKFDCYSKAEPDEPVFILLARDPDAPKIVLEWVKHRITRGDPLTHERMAKIHEAVDCAIEMEKWRNKNR